jgi:hypothetical protein
MADYQFKNLTSLTVKPLGEDQGLEFHLTFQSTTSRQDTIRFQLSPKPAMVLLQVLKQMQEKFDWPMPQFSSKAAKKRSLRVVDK